MTIFSSEGQAAIKTILRCMEEAEKAFSTLSADENKICWELHSESASLNHCVQWGLEAAQEVDKVVADILSLQSTPSCRG